MTIRDDHSLLILQTDKNGDLDEVEVQGSAASGKWISGCLYEDKMNIFFPDSDIENEAGPNILLFLLDVDGNLSVSPFSLNDGSKFCKLISDCRYSGSRILRSHYAVSIT